MKTKMREKVRPKMGKIDIDYQKLHDAFFKWQIKPKLTIHGDLYYEVRLRYLMFYISYFDTSWSISNSLLVVVCQGKEFETRLKEKKPGDLSGELRIALGMPTGPVSASSCSALHNKAFPFCAKQLLFCSVKVQESCSDAYVILCVIVAVLCLRRTLIKFLRRG